jgi:hypothetical protein
MGFVGIELARHVPHDVARQRVFAGQKRQKTAF